MRPLCRVLQLLTGFLLMSCPLTLAAQVNAARAADSSATSLPAHWRVGAASYVRVSAVGVRREGQFTGASNSEFRLTHAGHEWRIPVQAIDTLWVRQSSVRQGSIAGAVAGGALLGGFALLFVSSCSPGPSEDPCAPAWENVQVVLSAAAVGAAAGALVGAAVGALRPRWQLRVP